MIHSPITTQELMWQCPICKDTVLNSDYQNIENNIFCRKCYLVKISHFNPKYWAEICGRNPYIDHFK